MLVDPAQVATPQTAASVSTRMCAPTRGRERPPRAGLAIGRVLMTLRMCGVAISGNALAFSLGALGRTLAKAGRMVSLIQVFKFWSWGADEGKQT